MGFLKPLLLAIIAFELGLLALNCWRAIGAEAGCIEKEREALLRFKAALGDDSSVVRWSSWGIKEPKRDCCEWEGVECNNRTGHVIKLHLSSDFPRILLKGEIDASLMELQYLMYLNLSSNYLFEQSSIPEFLGSLTHLRYLDLHSCGFTRGNIPIQLGLLSHLQYLDLSSNLLEGAIPYQLGNLSQLQYLDLSNNDVLGGAIPHHLGNLSQLRHLDLSGNNLAGSIPFQLGNLSQLQYLDLSDNFLLGGAIPHHLGNLSQLRHLDLSGTNLAGSIPFQLGNLSQLQYLDLSDNVVLRGAIPHQLGKLSQLRHLDLSITNLAGSIPHQLGNLSNLQKLLLNNAGTLTIYQANGTGHEWLSSLTSLTHLMLGSMIDLKYSQKWLQMIAKLPNLKELIIKESDLSDEYILSLPSLKFNSSSSLSKLDLSGNNFESPIVFNWILNISTYLVDVSLLGNHLEGPIPYEFVSMMNYLEDLDLGSNQLKGGLESLGHICTLHYLSLRRNLLSEDLSTILQTFSTCARNSLQHLDLSYNQITGTLVSLSIFTSLKNFHISRNILNGTISKDLQFPSSLVSLDICSNFLRGVLTSSHLANLHNLKSLYLSDNLLTLRFSHNWVPPFQLEGIYVRSCKLGPDFPEWLQTQNHFTELDISNNGISGTIPEWFWGLLTTNLINLNASCNNISGTIPNVDIKFTEYGPVISLASNQFEGSPPRFLQNAEALFLSNNNFSELHQFLCANGSTQQLTILDLSNNQFFGQLPNCWSNFQWLALVKLSDNNFSGELPATIGTLQELRTLILRNNEFNGDLFITLKNCSSLALLDAGENKISQHISSWIGIQLYELKILILRNNNISGSLSAHLCSLPNLHFLDLSFNNLSGQIPQCFQNFTPMAQTSSSESSDIMTHQIGFSIEVDNFYDVSALMMWKGTERIFEHHLLLKGIDLSSNKLVGKIPPELGMLVDMISLNLSRNKLDGEIPLEIGKLTSLDSLDLSRNHLSGQIPSSFAQIDRLAVLDLSYNNLFGKIPTSTQLQSFDMSSYEGNLGLCGKPLEIKCPEDEQRQPQESINFQEDNDSILSREFYWSMSFGFIFGFWGIFGPVLLIRTWRHVYFKFLNNLADAIYVMVVLKVTKCNRWIRGYMEKLG